MVQVPNGGTTADPNLTVTADLTGTGVVAGDIARLYNGGVLLDSITLSGTDISNNFVVFSETGLPNTTYNFNVIYQNATGTSPHSGNYVVTVDDGGGPPSGATLLFSEDFDAPLDLKSTGNPNGVWMPNDFWQSVNLGYKDFAGTSWNANPNESAVNLNPFSVGGSVLTITANRIPSDRNAAIAASMAAQGQSGAPSWYGGILIVNPDRFAFTYGYAEARFRLPTSGRGMFPAWWLYNSRGGSKTAAEIDMFEIFGDIGNLFHTSVHGSTGFEVGQHTTDTTAWHTYGIDKQPSYLRFYEDGVLLYQVTGSDASWFDVPMGLRINFAMDASWFPANNKSNTGTPAPMTMEVDYIKVWDQLP